MATALFFQSTTKVSWFRKLRGVLRAAKENGWFIHVLERNITPDEVSKFIKAIHPIGCIVDRGADTTAAPDRIFKSIPTVYLDQDPRKASRIHPSLINDSASEAILAGKSLLELQCQSYAYLSTGKDYFWDGERKSAFAKLVKAAGKRLHVINPETINESLKQLSTPIGLLAANDYIAIAAYQTAKQLRLSIPDDLAIISIDNDKTLCDSVNPGLSSVEPDFEGAGYRLVKMLEAEIATQAHHASPNSKPAIEKYGAIRLVQRGSSRKITNGNFRIGRAMEYIRQHACDPSITLDAIAAEMKCSRKLATQQFRIYTGHTILDEIHEHRLNRIFEMLSTTDLPILEIIYASGYAAQGYPMKLFRKRTGMTMREWRKDRARTIGRP